MSKRDAPFTGKAGRLPLPAFPPPASPPMPRFRTPRGVSAARVYDALWLLKRSRFGDDDEFPTLPEVRLALDAAKGGSDDPD